MEGTEEVRREEVHRSRHKRAQRKLRKRLAGMEMSKVSLIGSREWDGRWNEVEERRKLRT